MAQWWHRYWFAPAPCLDLAVVRIIAVALQLYLFRDFLSTLEIWAALPADNYRPGIVFGILNLPFGWGYRPEFAALEMIYYVGMGAGLLALVGLLTNLSLVVFATSCVYLMAFRYSFGDFHHPEAVMMVALSALAISPAGRVLSLDSLIAARRRKDGANLLFQESEFAGWPLKLIQWFFVLMYLSAVWHKLSISGLDWANGYTLQYYLARDALRWDNPIGLMLSAHHTIVQLGQYGVLLFQATFALPVIVPKLRWLYVPAGLILHIVIWITLLAPFPQWIALYAVFIPWTAALRRARERVSGRLPAALGAR